MTLCIYTSPQHAPPTVNSIVDNEEVVVSRETMFVHQMASTLLPLTADLVAAFHKTRVCLLSFVSPGGYDRIVVLCDVEVEEVGGWEVLLAVGTAVGVRLLVVQLIPVSYTHLTLPTKRIV